MMLSNASHVQGCHAVQQQSKPSGGIDARGLMSASLDLMSQILNRMQQMMASPQAGPSAAAAAPPAANGAGGLLGGGLGAELGEIAKLLQQILSGDGDSATGQAGAAGQGEGSGSCGIWQGGPSLVDTVALGAGSVMSHAASSPGPATGAAVPADAGGTANGAQATALAGGQAASALRPEAASSSGVPAGATSGVPGAPDTVPRRDDKPTDPGKTVDDYLSANNGLLKNLGNQEGMKDKLKDRYGDWDDASRSPEEREQSAYNASRHLGTIKHKHDREGGDRGDVVGNGKMEGCTKDGDIRDGTEMADLKNSLKDEPPVEQRGDPRAWDKQDKNTNDVLSNPNLKDTRDPHVRLDGTNRNNDAVNLERAGKIISFINPVLGSVLKGAGEADRKHEVGLGEVLKGAAGGYLHHLENVGKGVLDAARTGRINPISVAVNVAQETVKDNVKDIVKDARDRDF